MNRKQFIVRMNLEQFKKEKVISQLPEDEREKSQYYSENYEQIAMSRAMEFQEKVVEAYIKLMEEMIK